MNTVLLSSSVLDTQSTPKASSRSGADTNADSRNEFAEVMAGQVMAQPQQAPASPSGNATTSASSPSSVPASSGNCAAPAQGAAGPQHTDTDPKQQTASPVRNGAAANASSDTAQAIRLAAIKDADVTQLPAPADDADTALPDRFRHIIDAMAAKRAGQRGDAAAHAAAAGIAEGKTAGAASGAAKHAAEIDMPGALAHDTPRRAANQSITTGEIQAARAQDAARNDRRAVDTDTVTSSDKAGAEPVLRNAKASVDTISAQHDIALASDVARAQGDAARNTTLAADAALAATSSAIAPAPPFSLAPTAGVALDTPITTVSVHQPLTSPNWAPEFGRQFSSIIRPGDNGSHIAELRLDPPELGPLRVTININDSVVQAVFSSAHAAVRNAVEQALPVLQQQLEQEGLSLGQTSVGDEPPSQSDTGHAGRSAVAGMAQHADDTSAIPAGRQRNADALVDTFA